MKTTQTEIKRRLNLNAYLAELAALTGRSIEADELGTPEEAAAIRERARSFSSQAAACLDIPFTERMSERFHAFVQRLQAANASPVYVWTPRTIDCGALVVSSLVVIHFDFDFTITEDGILSFVTTDLEDRLLLDFSASAAGNQLMTIETQGRNWATLTY